ncbi:MAG: diaminopimelate decarboxylase [Fervidobacterium sp.]
MILPKSILKNIGERYGTPIYVYSEKEILKTIEIVKGVFRDLHNSSVLPTFACKANNNPRLIEIYGKHGFGVDIVSLGEYYAAKKADIVNEKIVWNGNGKSLKDMEYLGSKIGFVNIDSHEEYYRWAELKNKIDLKAKFFLRINPDVDARTHPHISTGLKKNKFGVHLEYLDEIMCKRLLDIKGFHIHIGSQITSVEPFEEAISKVLELSKKYGLSMINIGGGWGINYKDGELDTSEFRRRVVPLLKDFELVIFELGRYLIARAGVLLLKVEYVKKTPHKNFIIVDGGMNVLMRPVLYNAYHKITVLEPEGYSGDNDEHIVKPERNLLTVDVVGPLCESGDVLALDREIPIPKIGSYILVENVGAYGFSMANNYNSMPRPCEVLVSERCKNVNESNFEIRIIRSRETIDDMFRKIL